MRTRWILWLLGLSACQTVDVYEPVTDREGIKRVIEQHRPEVVRCYHEAIEARPGAEGKVVMAWEIQPDGRTSAVTVKSTDQKIQHISLCLSRVIGAWTFPPLAKEEVTVNVSYPFFFSENGRVEVK